MFNPNINDYVIECDITNHLQLNVGDVVTISQVGYTQLKSDQAFWRNIAIGGTVTALSCGLATGFVGIGILGSEIAIGMTAAEIAVAGGLIGGTATALTHQAYNDAIKRQQTLATAGFIGKVLRIDTKFMSELSHVEVEFHIPQGLGEYEVETVWIDAHHLMTLTTKTEDAKRAAKLQTEALEQHHQHESQLLVKHREEFAPENVKLQRVNSNLTRKIASKDNSIAAQQQQINDRKKQVLNLEGRVTVALKNLSFMTGQFNKERAAHTDVQSDLANCKTQRTLLGTIVALAPFLLLL